MVLDNGMHTVEAFWNFVFCNSIVFKQKDIDALVQQADPRGPLYAAATAGSLILTVAPRSSRAILHLCVSVSAPARA